jgi:hypothetical protein
MSLTFDGATHIYELDGVRVPSVTGILKDSGLIDFASIPPTFLERARERGSAVHAAIHYYNERDLDVAKFCEDFPQYAGFLHAWMDFCSQRRFVPVLNEYRVASRRHRVAGTLDCLGLLDGSAVLLDFKTGRPHDVAANLQTAAYHALALEWAKDSLLIGDGVDDLHRFLNQHPVIRRYAVQLKRDGRFSVEAYTAATDYREFIALVEARRIVEKHKGSFELGDVAA